MIPDPHLSGPRPRSRLLLRFIFTSALESPWAHTVSCMILRGSINPTGLEGSEQRHDHHILSLSTSRPIPEVWCWVFGMFWGSIHTFLGSVWMSRVSPNISLVAQMEESSPSYKLYGYGLCKRKHRQTNQPYFRFRIPAFWT